MRLDAHQMRAIADAVEQLNRRFDNYVTARSDASHPDVGKTHKQMASKLRRSAEADRRGSGKKPLPGRAHGEPDEFSLRSAATQEAMAKWHEEQAAAGKTHVTEEDITARPNYHRLMSGRADAGVFEAAKHARDKAGQFAKTAVKRVERGVGNFVDRRKLGHEKKSLEWAEGGEKDIRRLAKQGKTEDFFGEYVKPGYWAKDAKQCQKNIKQIEARIKGRGDALLRRKPKAAGLTRDILAPGSPGRKALTAQLAKNKARGEHVAKVVQQTMRGK